MAARAVPAKDIAAAAKAGRGPGCGVVSEGKIKKHALDGAS
jgi:hypothetical protein